MKEFPEILDVKNKENFPDLHYNRVLCYFRKSIYEHIIKEEEKSYFDLNTFKKKYLKKDTEMESMVKTIVEELGTLGWKCKTSFGGTALFIYSSEKPPHTCWDDGFD